MTFTATLALLFLHPLQLPPGGALWMFFPLAMCVAVVYRATRAHSAREMPIPTLVTFLNICFGMIAIAVGAFILSELVIHRL